MQLTTVNEKKQGPKGEQGDFGCARVTGNPEVEPQKRDGQN